ncbi:pappalysin-2-like [Huso huso]|uniref:Pappalysin-2-like n=1 Tax=Huso huso TaxID=61971 RepID=A0ABR0ZIP2_HUSHU
MNIWLLNSVQSDRVRRYKRALALRADQIHASMSGEKCCSASTARQRRSVSQHHPLGAYLRNRADPGVYKNKPVAGEVRGSSPLEMEKNMDAQQLQIGTSKSGVRSEMRPKREVPSLYLGFGKAKTSPEQQGQYNSEDNHPCSSETATAVESQAAVSGPTGVLGDPKEKTNTDPLAHTAKPEQHPKSLYRTGKKRLPRNTRIPHSRRPRSLVGEFVKNELQGYPRSRVLTHMGRQAFRLTDYSAEKEDYSREHEESFVPSSEYWGPGSSAGSQRHLTTMYFSGKKEQVKLHPASELQLPRSEFTVELWVKPEGGQNNPAIIAGVFDNCSHSLSDKGWSVGIQSVEPSSRKDARFFFTIRTDRSRKATTVIGHKRYHANTWTHLVASYNGQQMTLYVDGAKVGESSGQSGDLYSPFMSACRTLLLGGDHSDLGHNFRGHLGGILLWAMTRPQNELSGGYYQARDDEPFLVLKADFSKAEEQWISYKDGAHPVLEAISYPGTEFVSPYLPPPCGLTVCDNTDVILSYNSHWSLRTEKNIRYRVVNICEDDGSNPTVSPEQIAHQHQALNQAFRLYNITWELTVHQVHNSTLWQRIILGNCETSKIGNDHCDPECDHPLTGYDGGDCRYQGRCYTWKRRDGICNMECNNMLNDFDDGDCCDPEVTNVMKTCFDPESPDRAYMSVKELKEALQLSGSENLNVFFAKNSVREELAGAATWPWAKEALSHLGGMVLNPSYFGTVGHTNTMIHELGHILGLYHVFKGVSERESCDDPCRETIPSLETGDLCADTAPTPKSKVCRDPDPVNDTCGPTLYQGTPFNNYMSYTDDDCTNSFTPNQVARMHCYLDLVYQTWVHSKKPAPIPVSPFVIAQSADSVSIHWLPPVSGVLHEREEGTICGDCDEDGTFRQYAHTATSPRVCDSSGYWTPEEAVGPPDVDEPCEPSLQAWSPELHLYDANMTVPCPQPQGCALELNFLHPVIAESLSVWTTYISTDSSSAISNIEVLTDEGGPLQLGPLHTFCDVPLTLRINTRKKVTGVKIYTLDEKMEIDAVLLSSRTRDPLCSSCRPLRYRLLREPSFPQGPVTQTERMFTDMDVSPGQVYRYTVQVEAEQALSVPSPVLPYVHGAPYCGDGQVQRMRGEECDDGNLLDGDGCSKKCYKEAGFNCKGEPSQCYVFDGDGLCEEFERGSSVQDCGVFTPQGFTDQWVAKAFASHQDDTKCPVLAVKGEPSLNQVCKSRFLDENGGLSQYAWFPCTAYSEGHSDPDQVETVWLKVYFAHPEVATSVIIYLASDGSMLGDQSRKTVVIQLGDTNGKNYTLGSYQLSCQRNPLVINMTHNLSLPFFRTASVLLNFSSPLVAVSGIALRTSSHISALALNGCAEGGVFSQQKQICVRRSCSADKCSSPQIQQASINCTHEEAQHLKCTIACNQGLTLQVVGGINLHPSQKETVLECMHGKWDRMVTCEPIDCGVPDQSHVYFASFSCPEGTIFGKQCSFSCNSPAKLQGGKDWLVCQEDGLWSFPEAYCKLECTAPSAVPNAKLLVPRCQLGGHDVGSICRYMCNPGYFVTGSPSKMPRKRFLKIACLEGGQWEEGGCTPVVCTPPSLVFEGMYSCTNGLEYDSQCTLNCPDSSERHTIRCTKEGKWTDEFKLCKKLQGVCPPLPELNLVEYSCEQGYSVAAVCYPLCVISLSDPVILPNNITADTMSHWMEPTQVESIVCTGLMRWHPDPNLIHCIQSCEPFQGDGWCDTINNRAHCQYDGGDCCPSTLSSRKVIPFGADCDQDECTCRDPNAEENQQRTRQQTAGFP